MPRQSLEQVRAKVWVFQTLLGYLGKDLAKYEKQLERMEKAGALKTLKGKNPAGKRGRPAKAKEDATPKKRGRPAKNPKGETSTTKKAIRKPTKQKTTTAAKKPSSRKSAKHSKAKAI